jgi:hypothetical protein
VNIFKNVLFEKWVFKRWFLKDVFKKIYFILLSKIKFKTYFGEKKNEME